MSIYEFIADSRFELLGWAAKYNNELTKFSRELPENILWKNTTVVIFNAPFDALILARYCGIYPPFIIDVLDLARHIEPRQENSLAALCERYKLPAKGDTGQFKGWGLKDFDTVNPIHSIAEIREKWNALIEYATNDADQEYALLHLLLPKLSNAKFEFRVMKYTRDLFIRPMLHLNLEKAGQLKDDMLAEVQKVLKEVDITEEEIRGNISFEMFLREALGSEEPPMKIGKKGSLLAIAKTDPGYEYLLNHPNDRARCLMEARVAVKSWPLHIKRVNRMMATFVQAGDRMPVPLRYYGAHTGRWSGCEKINFHNLPARGHPLINKIRNLIEAPKGYTLIIEDFAQIEARVLDWLAGQNDMIRAWADGEPIYCNFASQLCKHRIRKPRETDSKEVAKWYGNYRQMGKIGILGCGFGMGWKCLIEYAKNTFKITMSSSMAKKTIKLYRQTHPMVVLFWEKLGKAFRLATQNTSQIYGLEFGLQFFRDGDATVIQLPSTRRLYYTRARVGGSARYPQLEMPNPANYGLSTLHMWGGYLAENIVQAVARDLLAEAVLRIEAELGLRIPLIVHDDMSIVVPEDRTDEYQPQIEDIARTPPVWASGLPIDIEGKISRSYIK